MAMMDPRSIGAHIRTRKPDLTPLELKVLENIIAREDFSDQTSIKEIAVENNVSEAMIVKLAKKLEFNGFREFRSNLVTYRKLEVSQLFNEISPDDSTEILISKVFGNSIQALEETQAILDVKLVDRAAEFLIKAREILLLGVGGSAVMAEDLAHKFLRIGMRSQAISDSHLMLMSSSVCTSESVVLAISHSGRTIDVIDSLKLARKNGARIIVVTNYATSPITELADIVLTSTAQGSMFLGENAAARVAMLTILDVLFVAIARSDFKHSEEFLLTTRDAVQDKRIK